jgi:hypothetical protein
MTNDVETARSVVWPHLNAGEAFDTWNDLADWVDWLVTRFRLRPREVPPCWYRHGAVVEELTALWGCYELAYDPEQSASAAEDWLRLLADARLRLTEWMARCGRTATEHRNDPDVTWFGPDAARNRFIGADCTDRGPVPWSADRHEATP